MARQTAGWGSIIASPDGEQHLGPEKKRRRGRRKRIRSRRRRRRRRRKENYSSGENMLNASLPY
jgi:hypothetical protein